MADVDRYDALAYASLPYPGCHPDALAVVAHLAGLDLPPPTGWRVLDLGCGDAGNLLVIAQSLPGARCVGIDANAASIERGRTMAAAAGLDVELHVGDITALPDDLGTFDAVLVHGVWSWVPEAVRGALPAAIAGLLAPDGIAYVSYLALPGSHLLAPARSIAARRCRGESDPAAQVAILRRCLEETVALRGAGTDDVYSRLLAAEAQRWETRPDFLLYHDVLDPHATAFGVEDVASALDAEGLAWLGETQADAWWRWRLIAERAARIRAMADDPLSRQACFDDVHAPVFKTTLFVGADRAPTAEAPARRVLDLHAAAAVGGPRPEPLDDTQRQLVESLGPVPTPVREIVAGAGLDATLAAEALLRLAATKAVTLHRTPPAWQTEPGERPHVSGLARAQAAQGASVTTLRHSVVTFNEDAGRALLLLLDGTRDRPSLAADLARMGDLDEASARTLAEGMDDSLAAIARMALLIS